MKAIFSKDIDPRCVYCKRAQPLSLKEAVCPKQGVVDVYDRCGSFLYDPLKRVPPRPAKLGTEYTAEDFSI